MSGHKKATITINQEEYDRLRQSESEMRTLSKDIESLKSQLSERKSNQFLEHYQDLEIRQSAFERVLSGIDSHIRDIEHENNQKLFEKESFYLSEIQQRDDELSRQDTGKFFNLLQDLQNTVLEQQSNHQMELDSLQVQFSNINKDQNKKMYAANQWLDAGLSLANFINDNYQHEFFCPGEWEQAGRELNYAIENLKLGMPEAVIVAAQDVFTQLSDLHVDLEMKEFQWKSTMIMIANGLDYLKAITIQNEKCSAIDLDGHPLSEQIDVNYWTSGDYERYCNTLEEFIQDIYQQNSNLTLGKLYQVYEITIPQLIEELENIIFFARMNVIKSQLRINIADLIVQALEEQGFGLVSGDYTQGDMRNPFNARVRNMSGSEIVVQVVPDQNDLRKNDFHLISIDRENITQHEMLKRAEEISNSLKHFGMDVSPVKIKTQKESVNNNTISHKKENQTSIFQN